MATAVDNKRKTSIQASVDVSDFFGRLFSFNNSLKLFHWHVTGQGSYAQHMALDQAIESLIDVLDRIVETTYANYDDVEITIPQTNTPSDIIQHCEDFYNHIESQRELFKEAFSQSILDDYQEAIHQLLYRLKRLQ